MDLRELHYFIILAEEGNISRAAERLYMTQPSLSHFIQQLETSLHSRLFVRTYRGIRLTPSGECFLNHAKKMMDEYQSAKSEISDMENLQSGIIRMGISSFRGAYIFPSILREFHAIYPGITVVVTEMDSGSLEEKVLNRDLDMALAALPLRHGSEFSQVDLCIRDEVCLIAAENHPILEKTYRKPNSDKKWIHIKEISNYTFIFCEKHTALGALARKIFKERAVFPQAYPANVSPILSTGLVRSGTGVAFSCYSWSEFCPDLEFISIEPDPPYIDLALIYPPDGYQSKACLALSRLFHK